MCVIEKDAAAVKKHVEAKNSCTAHYTAHVLGAAPGLCVYSYVLVVY